MHSKIVSFVLIFLSLSAYSQLKLDTLGWRSPVDIPIYLSGNFAELRTGHFHAGIDIKTQGKEGFKVYAVQDGYVSRIKISSTGYGKAIYITHPDGYTSVYGHMKEYNIQLDKYAKALQYKNESYEIDIFPEQGELPVKKGDIMGLTGNTGSSGGPHLHFEVRETKNSHPLNGLFLGFDIKDNIPPKMEYLYAYPQNENSSVNGKNTNHFYSLKSVNGHFALRQGDTLNVKGSIGFGVQVNDYMNGSANRCGIYELKTFLNDELYFYDKFDGFSFGESRYINSLMDYKENEDKKRKLHKLFVEPNNRLSVYVETTNRGIIDFTQSKGIQKITVEAFDAYSNKTYLTFYVNPVKAAGKLASNKSDKIIIPWQNEFKMDTLGLQLSFEDESFYDTLRMDFSIDTLRVDGIYSATYNLHDNNTPVHKYFEIAIKYDSVIDSLQQKLLLGLWKKDKFSALGGIIKDGYVRGLGRELGSYCVIMDTVNPTIKPLGVIARSNDLSSSNKLQFLISDDLSGISTYKGTINDMWVLYEYDAKNNLLSYEFDEHMPNDGVFKVKIEVIDGRGNTAVFEKDCERYSERDYDIGQ